MLVILNISGGALSEADAAILMPRLMLKRASLLATTLRGRPLLYKANLVERFKSEALPAIANGKVLECLCAYGCAHIFFLSNSHSFEILVVTCPLRLKHCILLYSLDYCSKVLHLFLLFRLRWLWTRSLKTVSVTRKLLMI